MTNVNVRQLLTSQGYSGIAEFESPEDALRRLMEIEEQQVQRQIECAKRLRDGAKLSDVAPVESYYPGLAITVNTRRTEIDPTLAFGFCRREKGTYVTTLSQLQLPIVQRYVLKQLQLVTNTHKSPIFVGLSPDEIPWSFIRERFPEEKFNGHTALLNEEFPKLDIGVVSRSNQFNPRKRIFPLARFSGMQLDYFVRALKHYCGTGIEHFQRFVILTNYKMFVDAFRAYSQEAITGGNGYVKFVEPENGGPDKPSTKSPQMPAYHLIRDDRHGITLINIGVGPSNPKTITDALAPLRPHCILMLGHCGGLRMTQRIGSYVVADGFVRRDGVMDRRVPLDYPIPPVSEVISALRFSIEEELTNITLREILEQGPVVTTADRFWEMCARQRKEFTASKALAVDMESAVVAANCFYHAIPYGVLLQISDVPRRGDIKFQHDAQEFYGDHTKNHLRMAIRACERMRQNPYALHSRKLRADNDPAWR